MNTETQQPSQEQLTKADWNLITKALRLYREKLVRKWRKLDRSTSDKLYDEQERAKKSYINGEISEAKRDVIYAGIDKRGADYDAKLFGRRVVKDWLEELVKKTSSWSWSRGGRK